MAYLLILAIVIFSFRLYIISSKEVVDTTQFTDYFQLDEADNGGLELATSNFTTFEKEYNFVKEEKVEEDKKEGEKEKEKEKSAPPPPKRAEQITYKVKKKDTIPAIAKKYGVKQDTILMNNKNALNNKMKVGDTITFPSIDGLYYKLEKNDTLSKIAKKYGNLDAFERIRAYAYPFKTQEQASNFVKELKNIANNKPFSIEQEGALTKVTISNNFRFRNLITNINKNRKIKAIVEKYNGTYKGIGSSSVMVLKNTPYYFESRQKAKAFLEELNDIAKRREYTDINIDDGNTHNSNNYFVLDDFKHTKTGEIYKRAYPIKYVDDFKH